MNNEIKICIYLKCREKPIVLTDIVTNEDTYENKVEFFHSALSGENKIVTIDFLNDNIIFNLKDVEAVVVSKPQVNTDSSIIVTDADDGLALSRDEVPESKPVTELNLGLNESEDDVSDLDADAEETESVEVLD